VLVLVRNFARVPGASSSAAGAGGTPWERRDLTLGARGSASVTLRAPPASGALELRLEVDDALAADDRAWGWIGPREPVDAVVVTRSPALAAAFERLVAGVPGGRIARIAPEEWTPAAAAGHRVAVLDGFVPPEEPDVAGTLYVAPPAGNAVCPTAATAAADVSVVDWDADHPILRGMDGLPPLTLARTSALAVPGWGRSVVLGGSRAASVPILSRARRRAARGVPRRGARRGAAGLRPPAAPPPRARDAPVARRRHGTRSPWRPATPSRSRPASARARA
jgi:hypothetical protein